MLKSEKGVAYFLFNKKGSAKEGKKILLEEGIECTTEKTPDYLFSKCHKCLSMSIDDSYTAEVILEENEIFFDSIHRESE